MRTRPSRDQSCAYCGFVPWVTCCSSADPPEPLRNTLCAAGVNKIVWPSGDHIGLLLTADAEVNRLAGPPFTLSSHRSFPPGRSRVATTRRPSGERRKGKL